MRNWGIATVIACFVFQQGCGSGLKEFPTAKASGKVLCEGVPVPHARVLFEPIANDKQANSGKAAMGEVSEDGTFVLSTYGNGDGAVVGRHRVKVLGANPRHYPDFSCECATNDIDVVMEVEVAEGEENSFEIVLTKVSGRKQKQQEAMSAEDLDDILSKDED